MPTRKRNEVSVWVSWMTGILAGDEHCKWAVWFKSHFWYDNVKRDFDSAAWAAQHNDLLNARVAKLTPDGWLCTLEDQNTFKVKGEFAEVCGKIDIVAIRDDVAKIIDAKTGKKKDEHYHQVLCYLLLAPLDLPILKGKRLVGELQYREGPPIEIAPEELTPDVKQRIVALIREVGGETPPAKVPSFRECGFCSIPKSSCPDRIEQKRHGSASGMF